MRVVQPPIARSGENSLAWLTHRASGPDCFNDDAAKAALEMKLLAISARTPNSRRAAMRPPVRHALPRLCTLGRNLSATRAKMVHAHDGAAVTEVAIASWWRRRLAFAFRFPDLTD